MRLKHLASLAFGGYLSLATSGTLAPLAAQQQEQVPVPPLPSSSLPAPGTPPTLPPTDVVGQPNAQGQTTATQPPAQGQGNSFDNFNNGLGDSQLPSVLENSIFGTVPVDGYFAPSTTTGTMLNIPDIQTPATVSPITRDVIRDQEAIRFTDVLRDAGAVVPVGAGLVGDSIFIRGQETGSRDFRKNGFFDPTLARRDLQNVERIEILKGPSSVLYGAGQPSGTVNFITKQPLDANFVTGGLMFGSFDLERYTVDANATGDGSTLYRVNAAYEDANSFRDFGYNERTFVAPAVTWVLDPETTTITWQGEYFRERRRGDLGIPAIGTDPLALPISRFVGEPGNDFAFIEEYRQQLYMTHKLDDQWTLFVGGASLFFDAPSSQTFAASPLPPPFFTDTQFVRLRQDFRDQEQAHSGMVNLAGDVDGPYFNHKMLFGTEQVYYDSESRIVGQTLNNPGDPLNPQAPFDAANPVYGVSPPQDVAFIFDAPVFRQERRGYYLQDYITLNENWQLLGGVRFDDVHFVFERNLGLGPARNDQRFDRTSPRAGIVFQPIPDIMSIYFNYSLSFNAPTGSLGFVAEPVQPETGQQFELGIKTMLTDELTLNVAGFHIERENVPFADLFIDPIFGPIPRFFQLGRQRSQGVELNLLGQITDVWSIVANWAYVDTELTDPNNPVLFGQPARNVPLHNGSFWTRYNFIQNGYRTFGAALGLVAVGNRTADLEATTFLPSYYRWDSGFFYKQGRMTASVYLENFGDIKYAVSSIDELQINPGAPFNARAQLLFTF